MLGILVGMDQKDRYAARCFTVAVLGHAGDIPVVVNNRCLGFYSAEKPRLSRSCRSSMVVDIPVVVQRPVPMVFLLGRPWRLRSCSIFPGGRCPGCSMPGVCIWPVLGVFDHGLLDVSGYRNRQVVAFLRAAGRGF